MPVTQSAKRALRKDRRRTIINQKRKKKMKDAIKAFKKNINEKTFRLAVSLIDRAAKNKVIHKNKAARLKSQLAKILKQVTEKAEKKPAQKIPSAKKKVKRPRKNQVKTT
ncbi:MAG: 30S ribosomal protein S20 [Microgenomates group bacterium]